MPHRAPILALSLLLLLGTGAGLSAQRRKTHRFKELGLELRLPQEWTFEEPEDALLAFSDGEGHSLRLAKLPQTDFADAVNALARAIQSGRTRVGRMEGGQEIFDRDEAVRFTFQGSPSPWREVWLFDREGMWLRCDLEAKDSEDLAAWKEAVAKGWKWKRVRRRPERRLYMLQRLAYTLPPGASFLKGPAGPKVRLDLSQGGALLFVAGRVVLRDRSFQQIAVSLYGQPVQGRPDPNAVVEANKDRWLEGYTSVSDREIKDGRLGPRRGVWYTFSGLPEKGKVRVFVRTFVFENAGQVFTWRESWPAGDENAKHFIELLQRGLR